MPQSPALNQHHLCMAKAFVTSMVTFGSFLHLLVKCLLNKFQQISQIDDQDYFCIS